MEDDDLQMLPAEVPMIEEPRGRVFHFYITGTIGDAAGYIKMIHTIKSCGPNDLVYLHINSPGGYLHTAIQIIHAIGSCRGTVVTCAEGLVASAASLLFFAGHAMEIGEFSTVMAHDASGGEFGTMANMELSIVHFRSTYRKLCESIYGQFLTKKEMARIVDGGSVYLDSEQTRRKVEAARKKAMKQPK